MGVRAMAVDRPFEAPSRPRPAVRRASSPAGSPPEASARCETQARFTPDFSGIRVHASRPPGREQVPPAVARVLTAPGAPLDTATRARMEARLGHRFDGVRVHTGAQAEASARAIDADAYTFGRDIVFGRGTFEPESPSGQSLLAHELAHVVQQSGSTAAPDPHRARLAGPQLNHLERQAADIAHGVHADALTPAGAHGIQRVVIGTKFSHPKGVAARYKSLTAHFDGARFTVKGDGAEVMVANAQSGRPVAVRAKDAKACGGDVDDTYLNNPKYVGIADNGPIPEGTFRFRAAQFATFSEAERLRMLPGGHYTDPFGTPIHGGDWGAGRVPLTPVSIVPAKKCGNTGRRSGFFLHGGVMPGSSGCIDIGNDGVDKLVALLAGYTGFVVVTVKYTAPPPSVGAVTRGIGRFTYPPQKDPSIWDRFKAVLDGD